MILDPQAETEMLVLNHTRKISDTFDNVKHFPCVSPHRSLHSRSTKTDEAEMAQERVLTRQEIVALAIGDGGNTTRGHAAIEALHRAGYAVQQPPTDPAPLIVSLRERGLLADADDVEALAMELDKFRRGWGPSTPTERMLRRADIITLRGFIEGAYAHLIELNMANYTDDDVRELNDGAINAVSEIQSAMTWISDRLKNIIIEDRTDGAPGPFLSAARAVS